LENEESNRHTKMMATSLLERHGNVLRIEF